MTAIGSNPRARATLLSLYSHQYPAIGESHGLSIVAGSLQASMPADQLQVQVLDMVEWGEESCDKPVDLIRQSHANILAVGLPYGTYSVFQNEYPALRAAMHGENPLIVLGGPIATYLSDRLLREVAPDAIIIIGEAEHVLPSVIRNWLERRDLNNVPNLHYIDSVTGKDVHTPRRLANLQLSALPFRGHVQSIRNHGGQIFTESSRGCSWAACTFCLRGLTDIAGRGHEYRRKSPSLVAADLRSLYEMGITDVTFADEDFLGSSVSHAQQFTSALEASMTVSPKFDASITIHSVFSRRDTPSERSARQQLLTNLARLGLQKVFLGIESCSPSQLKRYAKGHTREEALAAARMLQRLGMRVEIGVILFDPLCTLDEIEDSLHFMRINGLARLASGLSSELRLQVASHYLTMLEKYEQQHGCQLHGDTLDSDTLSYPYIFADDLVQQLFSSVGMWNRRLHPLYYPAKSLSRFGATGAMGAAVHPLREATEQFRDDSADALLLAIAAMKAGHDSGAVLDERFTAAATSLARAVLGSVRALTTASLVRHPVVQRASAAAEAIVRTS
jgi:hypothetical protein